MSHRNVEQIIGGLLTDEDLRLEFLRAPDQVLERLIDQGWELSRLEVEGLIETNFKLWRAGAARIDPRLQRCSLKTSDHKKRS